MNLTTRYVQARVNALANKEVLKVDGMTGPKTRKAVAEAMAARGVRTKAGLFHDTGMVGIVWHWTASHHEVTADDLAHYNDVHDVKGNSYDGAARAEHQLNYDWRKGIGVSHTRNLNTGFIGQSVAAMAGAEGWPSLKWGKSPLTWEGIDAMLERSAEYCREFDIPVSPWSTLSHAEVQGNLGVAQRNKWDYMVLPGMKKVTTARACGDILRKRLLDRHM
jgi:hypothetical protein